MQYIELVKSGKKKCGKEKVLDRKKDRTKKEEKEKEKYHGSRQQLKFM
jgi:hypothetical protein